MRRTLEATILGSGTINAYALASGDLWPLGSGFDPAISPDGRTAAFVREERIEMSGGPKLAAHCLRMG
ncbi:MAG: PD40 domain-containing protein [Caldilineaceae bacterium]|nr:PD40 domain-containing protein [Caldilineaceae bacterium]